MNIVTLAEIKAHTRIDGNAEDSLLTMYAEAAEETVLNYIERPIEELYEIYGKIPVPIKQAVLLLVDNSYQNRSPVSTMNMYSVPYTFDALVKPYISL